jgi:alpha-ketoglutarate-dependent taurine dioxygenase
MKEMMKSVDERRLGIPTPSTIRRRTISTSQLINTRPLVQGHHLPLVVEPTVDGIDLSGWAKENRDFIDGLLLEHRALLFRGFNVASTESFSRFVAATSAGAPLEYRDRSTPRTKQGDGVYSSTIHPSDQRIDLHNEGTYWIRWALKLYFCASKVATQGGETPIADVRNVYRRIDAGVRQRFLEKQMMFVRNYNDGFGLPWQEVFQTGDKAEVEGYCTANLIDWTWKSGDRLRTQQIRPAVRKHPKTGEPVWFNHAAFFHYTALEPSMQRALVNEFGVENLPFNTYYGDGSPIEPDVVAHIRDAYEREKVVFPWLLGDVLLVDNMTVAHAREPYAGERLTLVAMAEPYDGSDDNS